MPKKVQQVHGFLEPYCIGLKLRSLRNQKRLTLARLAAETGLSTALLSKLETDRMVPTLATLSTICRVYGVGLSHFFVEPAHHTLSITRKAHLLESPHAPDPLRTTPLNPENTPLIAQMVELRPGVPVSALDSTGSSTRFVYVLEGSLSLNAGGRQELLDAGDCVCLDSELPLAWTTADQHRCRVLSVAMRCESQDPDRQTAPES